MTLRRRITSTQFSVLRQVRPKSASTQKCKRASTSSRRIISSKSETFTLLSVSSPESDAMLVSQSMSARDNFYPGTGILCSNTKTLSGMNADIRDVLRAYFNLRFAVLPFMIHILSTATGTGL